MFYSNVCCEYKILYFGANLPQYQTLVPVKNGHIKVITNNQCMATATIAIEIIIAHGGCTKLRSPLIKCCVICINFVCGDLSSFLDQATCTCTSIGDYFVGIFGTRVKRC